jgi:hypothetical protein
MQIMNQLPRKTQASAAEVRRRAVPEQVGGVVSSATGGRGVFVFQPLITIKGDNNSTGTAILPFGGWFDGKDVEMAQFRVEILWCSHAKLVLESSPFPEEAVEQWGIMQEWTAIPSGGFEIVTAVSDSSSTSAGKQFSRYIRWRAMMDTASAGEWEVCFRIKAVVGSTFTQAAETPRIV